MKKAIFSIALSLALLLCLFAPAAAVVGAETDGDGGMLITAAPSAYVAALSKLLDYYDNNKDLTDIWEVMGLAAAGVDVGEYTYDAPEADVLGGSASAIAKAILYAAALGENPRSLLGVGAEFDLVRALAAMQGDDGTIGMFVTDLIYSIIALENTDASAYDRDAALEALLAEQFDDGGFGWAGWYTESDPDLSGMALLALSYFKGNPAAEKAIKSVAAFLADALSDNGGYIGWTGSESCESAATVISGLVACGLSGAPVFEPLLASLLDYQTEDGSFGSSVGDDEGNFFATSQALFALCDLANGESYLLSLAYDASGAASMFADAAEIKSDSEAAAAALLYHKGIIVGCPGAILDAAGKLTVGQLAVMLDKLYNPGAEYSGAWYASAMARMIDKGLFEDDADALASVTYDDLSAIFGCDGGSIAASRGDAFVLVAALVE